MEEDDDDEQTRGDDANLNLGHSVIVPEQAAKGEPPFAARDFTSGQRPFRQSAIRPVADRHTASGVALVGPGPPAHKAVRIIIELLEINTA